MPLHVRYAAISLSGAPLVRAPLRWKKSPFAAMGASDDPHCPLRVPHQPAVGEREAGGEGDNGGDGAPTPWQIANGG